MTTKSINDILGDGDLIGGNFLLPSGGDDAPAMAAMAASNKGRINLGPGVFKVNTQLTLSAPVITDNPARTVNQGIRIYGQGADVTVIDTSACVNPACTFVHVESVPANNQLRVLTADIPADLIVGAVIRMEIASGMIVCNQNDYTVSAIAVDTGGYSIVTVTNGIGSQTLGVSTGGGAWNAAAYNGIKAYSYYSVPTIFICPTYVNGVSAPRSSQQTTVVVEDISFIGVTSDTLFRDQVCLGFGTDEVSVTRVTHGLDINRCNFWGYDAAIYLDDVTNWTTKSCSFKGCAAAVWSAYNVDIGSMDQCHIGSDANPANWGAAVGITSSLIRSLDQSSSANVLRSCWILGAQEVFRSRSGGQFKLDSCYLEETRFIGSVYTQGQVYLESCYLASPAAPLTTVRSAIYIPFAFTEFISIKNCNGTGNYTRGLLTMNVYSASEVKQPRLVWESNKITCATFGGQLYDSERACYILLPDGVNSGDTLTGTGSFSFQGPVQTGGDIRYQNFASAASITPLWNKGTGVMIQALAVNTTINAFSNTVLTTPDQTKFWSLRRHVPVRFVIQQDATAGRTVTWNSSFVFHTPFVQAVVTTDANKWTEVEFRWTGSNWRQVSPVNVWI